MTTNDNSLLTFKAISNFTKELNNLFSKEQHSLKLYARLIDKTTISHDASIRKHVEAFRHFCITNRDAIMSKDVNKIQEPKIVYSEKVFIDMTAIFMLADTETTRVIWQHILCISALVDPAGKARELLKENLASGKSGNKETDFLTDIIDKVEKHVDPNLNPMEAVSSIMKSGVFTDLIGGMNQGLSDGSLNIGKLMGAVQGMVGQLGEKSGGNPQTDDAMKMLSTMMAGMGNMGPMTGANTNPNMPDMMTMMQGMMASMNTQREASEMKQLKQD